MTMGDCLPLHVADSRGSNEIRGSKPSGVSSLSVRLHSKSRGERVGLGVPINAIKMIMGVWARELEIDRITTALTQFSEMART
jgi:hypothetical protein